MEKEFLTVRSLSKLLDRSEQTTYKLAREGVIPGPVKGLVNQFVLIER